jgi:hypothetical protein
MVVREAINVTQFTPQTRPKYLSTLEAAYGAPSQAAFGSAVFFEQGVDDLEMAAQAKYRYFVGSLWKQYGEAAWLGPWKKVYARQSEAKADIVWNCAASPMGLRAQQLP